MLYEFLLAGLMIINPANAANAANAPDYRYNDNINNKIESIECLAMNMYHEARDQGSAGLLAVTSVVLNRVKDKRFPNTICEVIYEGPMRESWKKDGNFYPIRDRCQFSWWCDGRPDEPKNKESYKQLLKIAESIYDSTNLVDITDGALFYHADYVRPAWADVKIRTVRIGNHIFYRWEV